MSPISRKEVGCGDLHIGNETQNRGWDGGRFGRRGASIEAPTVALMNVYVAFGLVRIGREKAETSKEKSESRQETGNLLESSSILFPPEGFTVWIPWLCLAITS